MYDRGSAEFSGIPPPQSYVPPLCPSTDHSELRSSRVSILPRSLSQARIPSYQNMSDVRRKWLNTCLALPFLHPRKEQMLGNGPFPHRLALWPLLSYHWTSELHELHLGPGADLTWLGQLDFFFSWENKAKKTALITGANKGIGREVARQLATQGYQVFIGSRDEARGQKTVDELVASGLADVHLLVLDVSNDESVKQAYEALAAKISALDVLVNNSGVSAAGWKTCLEESLEEFIATYQVNVFGVVRTTNAFIPLLKKSKAGRIVNVSSGLASLAHAADKNHPNYAHNALGYNSSKTALNHVTVSYAKALAEFGIKVNSSNPGYTATDMTHNNGPQTVEVGAKSTVFLATLPDDGPTASFYDKDGVLPW